MEYKDILNSMTHHIVKYILTWSPITAIWGRDISWWTPIWRSASIKSRYGLTSLSKDSSIMNNKVYQEWELYELNQCFIYRMKQDWTHTCQTMQLSNRFLSKSKDQTKKQDDNVTSRNTRWLPDVSAAMWSNNSSIVQSVAHSINSPDVFSFDWSFLPSYWRLNIESAKIWTSSWLPTSNSTHNSSVINHNLVELTRIWMEFLLNMGHITFNLMKFNLKML